MAIEGAHTFCRYGQRLEAAVLGQETFVTEQQEVTERTGTFPMINTPEQVIPGLQEHLAANPCEFLLTGVCEVATYAVDQLAVNG